MPDLILSDEKSYDVEISYWKEKLQGAGHVVMPTDFTKTGSVKNTIASFEFNIEQQLVAKLGQLSEEQEVSLFNTLLATYKVLLYRYSNQEDICVGNIPDNAVKNELTNSGNPAFNTLVLRSSTNGEELFIGLLNG